MAPVVTMSQLLEAGVHFGHQTRRWNPKMERFIWGERNGIYVIDLAKTMQRIGRAYEFVRDTTAAGGTVLFVGTKKQAQEPIRNAASSCGQPYVIHRWLGGMLTNFRTISGRVQKMKEFERMKASGDFSAMPKKEALMYSRELEKLQQNLGGMRAMAKLPDALFILDTGKEHIAVAEANRLGLPVVGVVDTNNDPDQVQYVIPGNDDAIRSTSILCSVIAEAVKEGQYIGTRRGTFRPPAAERSPEEEARIAAQQAEASRAATNAARDREARIAAQMAAAPPAPPEAPPHEGGELAAPPGTAGDDVAETTIESVPSGAAAGGDEAMSTDASGADAPSA